MGLTLQLRTTEIFQNLFPVWWVFISPKIWFGLATQDFQSSTLSYTIGANQTKNLTRSWCGKTVKLEAVGRVAMGDLCFKIGRQIDDIDCAERAFLGANTTSDA